MKNSQETTTNLNSWQTTCDNLRDLTPKWGMQSIEAIKTSIEVGVPMVILDVRTPSVCSTLAMGLLQQLGYKNAIMISGGITAWKKAKYPVMDK